MNTNDKDTAKVYGNNKPATDTEGSQQHQPPVINLTKASRKGSYRVRVSLEGEPGGGPLTLAQLKSLVLGSTVAIEVNGVTITFAARELGHAKKSGEAYRLRNVQVSDGKRSKLITLELD